MVWSPTWRERLTRVSVGFTFAQRDLLLPHRSLVDERSHDDRRLPEISFAHALEGVHVGVMRADVIVRVLLNRVEARHSGANETEVVGVADAGRHIAPRA